MPPEAEVDDPSTQGDNESETVDILETRGDIEYVSEEFRKGDLSGATFAVPQPKSLDAAEAKYGAQIVLEGFQDNLANKLRTKVKNYATDNIGTAKEPVPAEKKAAFLEALRAKNNVLFTVDEAEQWIPGSREPRTLNALSKKTIRARELYIIAKGSKDGKVVDEKKGKAADGKTTVVISSITYTTEEIKSLYSTLLAKLNAAMSQNVDA